MSDNTEDTQQNSSSEKKKKSEEDTTEQKNTFEPEPVFVKAEDTKSSPHVINLKEEEPGLEEIQAFREKLKQQRERKVVDFAEMVREANDKSLHREEDIRMRHDNPSSVNLNSTEEGLKQSDLPDTSTQKNTPEKPTEAGPVGSYSSVSIQPALESFSKKINRLFSKVKSVFSFSQDFSIKSTLDAKSSQVNKTKEKGTSPASSKKNRNQDGYFFGVDWKKIDPGEFIRQKAQKQKDRLQVFYEDMTKRKAFSAVMILLLVLFLPFPVAGYYNKIKQDSRSIVKKSTHGFSALTNSSAAIFSSNIEKAKYDLSSALRAFDKAQSIIKKDYQTAVNVASVIPIIGDDISARKNLLSSGHHLALGNTYLVKGVSDARDKTSLPLTERLEIIQNHLNSAIPQYEQALRSFATVSKDEVPKKYRQVSENFKVLFIAMIGDMKDLSSLIDTIQLIFGQEGYHKYIVLFQNSNELRPLGGFAGSFAVVEVQKGKVSWKIPSGGTYDLQGQMNMALKPPVPLQMVNSKWEFQDANYFSHLPASAKVIEDMYVEARGSSIDGVITVNSDVLKRVMEVTGPIEQKQFDQTLTKDNILRKIQKEEEQIEKNSDKKPKAILSTITDNLMDKIKSGSKIDLLHLALEAYQALNQKQIQVYMEDDETQETLRSYGWTGEILPSKTKQDYLHVVHSNLQGQKSNAKIKESLNLKTKIKSDGSVVNKLIINRRHTADPDHPLYGSVNFSHVRAYVPQGSKIVEVKGFEFPPEKAFRAPKDHAKKHPVLEETIKKKRFDQDSGTKIYQQFGKTVFSHWLITKPGQTSRAYIKYKLPFKIKKKEEFNNNLDRWKHAILEGSTSSNLSYSMLVQKQSGTSYPFTQEVVVEGDWRPIWKSDEDIWFKKEKIRFSKPLKTDLHYGFMLENK
ncbi:MAG: DUF4012 domain-containing protein [Candidatus Magasanikbacteria bacterium]